MAKRGRVSGESSNKGQKVGEPKLPSIPADSAKLSHMKLFNEWMTFSWNLLWTFPECLGTHFLSPDGHQSVYIYIYINIVPSRATKGWIDRSPWDIRWLHSQETGDQGQLLILVDCFSPGKHGVAGKACRVLQDHRCSLSTGRQRAWPSFVNKINITRHKVLGVPQQEKYCNTETQLKDPYSFGC